IRCKLKETQGKPEVIGTMSMFLNCALRSLKKENKHLTFHLKKYFAWRSPSSCLIFFQDPCNTSSGQWLHTASHV
uniref:Uncharacterized protein n=1 Tax=Macaca fascicularis TaxID=9541 RepID=A0A7N9D4Z6_MACFA